MKKEEIKKMLEELLPGTKKVVCLCSKKIKGELYTEWAIIDKVCENCDALISLAGNSIYQVKHCSASMLRHLAKIK